MVLKSGYYHLTTVEYRSAGALVKSYCFIIVVGKGHCFCYLCYCFLEGYRAIQARPYESCYITRWICQVKSRSIALSLLFTSHRSPHIQAMSPGNEPLVVGSRSQFSPCCQVHYLDTDCIGYFFRVQIRIRKWSTLVPLGYDVTHFQQTFL